MEEFLNSVTATARPNSTVSSDEFGEYGRWADESSGHFSCDNSSGYSDYANYDNTHTTISYRVVPVLYLIISLVGLLGNGFAITALLSIISKDKMKCVPDILVLNLAVADFILMATLPFMATRLFMEDRWVFGTVGCTVSSFINYQNFYGSVFFVAAMAIDRLFGIVYPIKTRIHRTSRKAIVVCIVIWIFATLFATPAIIWGQVRIDFDEKHLCVLNISKFVLYKTYILGIRIGFGFFLPFVVIVFCYIVIMLKLRRRKSSRLKHSTIDKKQQRITKIILAVISVFFVSCFPSCVVKIIYHIHPLAMPNIGVVMEATSCIGCLNSAINPFLYAYIKKNTRDRLKAVLTCKTCKRIL